MHGRYDMNGWGWAGMTGMAVIMVAILGLVWFSARRGGEPRVPASTAREKRDAPLARGEIDAQEYQERLEALSGDRVEG